MTTAASHPTAFATAVMEEISRILDRIRPELSEEEHALLVNLMESYEYVTQLVEDKKTTIARLRKMLFGASTESTENVLKKRKDTPASGGGEGSGGNTSGGGEPDDSANPDAATDELKPSPPGHGRNGADEYKGADRNEIRHPTLKSGDACPDCPKGRVYDLKEPRRLVRIIGQAPITARIHEIYGLRCSLCQRIHFPKTPDDVGEEKYDATAAAMIAVLKYGTGMPFYRLQNLQWNLGIPLPASTQWGVVKDASKELEPVREKLIELAASGEVIHNDDTGMKVLALIKRRKEEAAKLADGDVKLKPARTGIFTSGIVAIAEGIRIALYFTGAKHAGENLADVLAHRRAGLSKPIQMCDALARNMPAALDVIVANCLAHGRREFVDVVDDFPEEVEFVLRSLSKVYRVDAEARERKLSPMERLNLHQAESKPVMDDLNKWFAEQFREHKVEPNSGLGHAIHYMTKRWDRLTLFLREPGAPLDNNICERALKKAILHRKNALFYKSEKGAEVGDLFMSLIHTAELAGVNAFEYLTALLRHPSDVRSSPGAWMPWNYPGRKPALDTG